MKLALLLTAAMSTLALTACDREPVVVNTPPATVVVPGPAGPAGETGATGAQGSTGSTGSAGEAGSAGAQGETGEKGRTGGDTSVIVVPAPPATTN